MDFSHFRNPAFLLFAISNFLLYMWYDVPYVYIVDNGQSKGFTESQSSMLISIIGIVNMFGEVSKIIIHIPLISVLVHILTRFNLLFDSIFAFD